MGALEDMAIAAARKAIADIERADSDAERSRLAFEVGEFDGLFDRKVAAARSRLEETYRVLDQRLTAAAAAAADVDATTAGGGHA